MLYTSEAIVLKTLKYSEHSSIVHMFTLEQGHQVFLSSRKSGRSKSPKGPLSPLTLIEIEAYLAPKKGIQRLKSYSYTSPFQSIPFHPAKNAIALFLSEIYWTCSNHEDINTGLFNFFKSSIIYFDIMEEGIANFHLKNLLNLSRLLGFSPVNNYSESQCFFNFQRGTFQALSSSETSNHENSALLATLLSISMEELSDINISNTARSSLLDDLIIYFKIHMHGFAVPKSIDVFREMI